MHRKTSPLLKILAMLEQQLTLPALVDILDVSAERVRAALEAFENRGWVRHCEDRDAYLITAEGALAAGQQTDWKECRTDVAGALECLDDGRTLDGCSSLLEIINRMLDSSLSGAISLYAFLIRTLKGYDLDAHGDDKSAFFRVTIDVCDISMYLSKFHNDALSLVAAGRAEIGVYSGSKIIKKYQLSGEDVVKKIAAAEARIEEIEAMWRTNGQKRK